MKQIVSTTKAPAAVGPYSQAVAWNHMLFLSGQIPLVPETGALAAGGLEAQVRQMFANAAAVLAEAGLDFSHVLKTTVFMTDLAGFAALNAIYAEYFPENPPARSCVQVAALPKGALVEMELIAAL